MSFHEKSAWACMCSIVLAFVPYFWIVFRFPMAFVGVFVLAVMVLVALLVAFHVVNSMATASIRNTGDVPSPDELDRLIELRAAKLSGIVLATIVIIWSLVVMFGVPAVGVAEISNENAAGMSVESSDFAIPVTQALFWVHLLFAGFVVANLTYYGSVIAGYRGMASG